jgi:hypothetical protein
MELATSTVNTTQSAGAAEDSLESKKRNNPVSTHQAKLKFNLEESKSTPLREPKRRSEVEM